MEKMNFCLPKMEVSEKGSEVVVKVFISGVDDKDIKLKVMRDSLEVDVAKDFSKEVKKQDYSLKEWASSSFEGAISLPVKVSPIISERVYDGKVLIVKLKKEK